MHAGRTIHHSIQRLLSSTATKRTRLEDLRNKLNQEDGLGAVQVLQTFASGETPHALRPVRKKAVRSKKDLPKPSWLKVQPADSPNYHRLRDTVRSKGLATVCEEAKCPNIGECWGGGDDGVATATIMIMGDTCTRGCNFCAVKTSRMPPPLDENEPKKVAESVGGWGLDYVVLTSVDRDDLPDQGSGHFRRVVQAIKSHHPTMLVEALTPDFQGNNSMIDSVATSGLDVYAHNIETVERMTPRVRDRRANYRQTLKVLERAKYTKPSLITKTSIMLGLGEEDSEILQTLHDLRDNGVDVVTFGQYLKPSRRHLPVKKYVTPEKFKEWGDKALEMGFLYAPSGPLVRSSYKAGEFFLKALVKERAKEGLV
eukprot:CAMPEP_0118643982 /NCGR_PEP_ID=MMETSP0785-20121206/6686_1 /TAXON_ID=91992 /ORGANISM="Bolidomonas pacifica, Strain CCMP 1866" /LENGTH=369 /DNA_ID=CAMNT_0006535691 /DNA_START=223 /DNA_END=1332 /DNA_ORIENTATION=-